MAKTFILITAMKTFTLFISSIFAIFVISGCLSTQRPSPASLAPLKADTPPEQIVAWPIIPVVKQQDGQPDNLLEQFGDAAPAVSLFLRNCMADFDAYQKAIKKNPKAPPPDFAKYFPALVQTTAIPTLSPQQKKNLDNLLLMHNLCNQMNSIFFMLTTPFKNTDGLQKALKTTANLHDFIAANPQMKIPHAIQRAEEDGDALGAEWLQLFDGMTPLSPIADEWTLSINGKETIPCRYGSPFPTGLDALAATKDQTLSLNVQTAIPHDGKTPIYIILQGVPPGFKAMLDGKALTVEKRKTSARILIPPNEATGNPQSLVISWTCTLHEKACFFRQPWFVMKN